MNRTFHESVRFPVPDGPVKVVIRKRDEHNQFQDVWTADVDPKSMFVDTSSPPSPGALIEIEKNGEPANKVDVLLLGDGYTAAERSKFERDARRMIEILFATSPFKERRRDFNVWGLVPPAAESGISRPSTGVHRASPIGATYDAFGSERYVLTFNNRAMREVAAFAPVRVHRDPDQLANLWWRRHLQSLQHGCGRQRAGALCLRARVRPSLRGVGG